MEPESRFTTLQFELDDEGIALITIDRPDKLNALNESVLNDLSTAFGRIRSEDGIRGVILTGSGEKSFVAGADIQQFAELDTISGHRFAQQGQAVFNEIDALPKPVIAAVNGFALGGGCELAMACHLRIASEKASFGQPEVNLGLVPGYGGTQRLPRLVGRGLATELILTGDRISARRAYEIGLVNAIVPPEALLEEARTMMKTMLSRAPLAISLALEAIRYSDLPLEEGLRYEAALFGQACGTDDFSEGVQAFLERRQPKFSGG